METIILPGFSPKNKGWAYSMKMDLEPDFPCRVIEWGHWYKASEGSAVKAWLDRESAKVIKAIDGKVVNVLAKSIGTFVIVNILLSERRLVNKLILCGIPLKDIEERYKYMYQVLTGFNSSNLLCIQNENDPHTSAKALEEFLDTINPEIKVFSKPREDHEYPYSSDFINFLK